MDVEQEAVTASPRLVTSSFLKLPQSESQIADIAKSKAWASRSLNPGNFQALATTVVPTEAYNSLRWVKAWGLSKVQFLCFAVGGFLAAENNLVAKATTR